MAQTTKPARTGRTKKSEKKVRECTAFGCTFQGFNVPKGALFGTMNGVHWVMTRMPLTIGCTGDSRRAKNTNTTTKCVVWVKFGEQWRQCLCHRDYNKQQSYDLHKGLNYSVATELALHNIAVLALTHLERGGVPKQHRYRNPYDARFVANVVPKERKIPEPMARCWSQGCVDKGQLGCTYDSNGNMDTNFFGMDTPEKPRPYNWA